MQPRIPLRCRLGVHPWDKDMNDENGRQRCPRCGRFYSRSIYYGTWALVVIIVTTAFVLISKCSGGSP